MYLFKDSYMLVLLKRTGSKGLLSRFEKLDAEKVRPEDAAEARKRLMKEDMSRVCQPLVKIYQNVSALFTYRLTTYLLFLFVPWWTCGSA